MSIAVLIEAAEFLERRERGMERLFICVSFRPRKKSFEPRCAPTDTHFLSHHASFLRASLPG